MNIRKFRPQDAAELEQIVAKTLRVSNSRDYSRERIEANIASHSAQVLIGRAREGHMYVACDGPKIVGCGTIAGYWGSRIEIPASITAVEFYRKLGYDYKNGIAQLDGEVYRLEKFR